MWRSLILLMLLAACSPANTVSPTAIPTVKPTLAAGQVVAFQGKPLLFVQEGGYLLYAQAKQEHDDTTALAVARSYEWIDTAGSTSARVVQVVGQRVQVDLLDGPSKDRRGWLDRANVAS